MPSRYFGCRGCRSEIRLLNAQLYSPSIEPADLPFEASSALPDVLIDEDLVPGLPAVY
jgi:hypothetical protein